MTVHIHRRDMFKTAATLGAGFWLGTSARDARGDSPNEKLNIAVIGVGGRGEGNLNAVSKENIVALCDVDDQRAGNAYQRFPKAKKFYDFRRMLDSMDRQIDAVVVSTPDHMHFHPSMMAMQMGKHLFCEKPMAHSVWEVRQMTELATQMKVATQLGVQRHTLPAVRQAVELIWSGTIGQVKEVHTWVRGQRGMPEIPTETPPVPPHLKWDLWLGPAAYRPYHPTYCPYGWRFWWDFGTGEMGNWGCHNLDIPFWALGLKYPTRVDATGPPVHSQTTPKSMTTRFEFPADGERPAVILHWYHAENGPPVLRDYSMPNKGFNNLFIGLDGMMLCGFRECKLYPADKFEDFTPPAESSIPDSPGFHQEWLNACRGGKRATCHFDYSGPLTETVLLGNTAYRAGAGFHWNAAELDTTGNAKAAELNQPSFRAGWQI